MRLILLLLLSVLGQLLLAQSNETYHRARVHLDGQSIAVLAALGLETDHGDYAPYKHLINDFSARELAEIEAAGFSYDILIADVVRYYQNPNRVAEARGGSCGGETDEQGRYEVPSQFRLGDQAGFYRYQEMLDILDSMRLLYPHLISTRAPIGEHLTHEGYPIYWLRISNQPDTEQAGKPQILYTSLHHAREPNSLTQNIFFMWYLLEHYETDPQVRFLIDHTELYFIPCVNPDGYIYNEIIEPEGGGLWRKNLRDNGDGTFGVDLNRNYGFEWGHDDQGSSPNPRRSTYRGETPFSEPETQAVRDFCEAHEFVVALNYHTHGNLLIYPWGYSDTLTADAPTFNALANSMTVYNAYTAGTGTETVGYVVNGDSDDWMYGETTTKPAIFALTPEVGGSGFWPAPSEIIPNCLAAMEINLIAANTPFVGAVAQDYPAQWEIDGDSEAIYYQVQRYGLQEGELTVSMSCLQNNWLQVSNQPRALNLLDNENRLDSFAIAFRAPNIPSGTTLDFAIAIDNGNFLRYDTIQLSYSELAAEVQWADRFDELNNWSSPDEAPDWQLTDEDFISPNTSLTDSPYEDYPDNTFSVLTLAQPLTVGAAEEYLLEFSAKWAIEKGYDYVQLLFQVNGGSYQPACGRYTVLGTEYQAWDEPLWDGRSDWVRERIDLTPYLQAGDELQLSFLLVSDAFVTDDGFYVDDLEFIQRNPRPTATTSPSVPAVDIQLSPNPLQDATGVHLRFSEVAAAQGTWQLFHPSGKLLQQGNIELGRPIPTAQLPAGTYWLHFQPDGYQRLTKKLVVLK